MNQHLPKLPPKLWREKGRVWLQGSDDRNIPVLMNLSLEQARGLRAIALQESDDQRSDAAWRAVAQGLLNCR